MVKAKKGKKEILATADGGSSADEIESQSQHMDSDVESDKVSANNKKNQPQAPQQKGKKKNKKVSDNEESDAAGDVQTLTKAVKKLNVKGKGKKSKADNDSDEEAPPKGKAAKKSAFELLMDDDDDADEPPAVQSAPDDDDDAEAVKPQKKNEKKGKKAKRKGKDDDDEDLDKVLAELQAEYAGEAPAAAVVTPEELADEFSKKKKNKKPAQAAPAAVENDAEDEAGDDDDEDGGSTMKTAAQKKKEKKERQKREAAQAKQKAALEPKQKPAEKPAPVVAEPEPEPVEEDKPEANDGEEAGDDATGKGVKNKKKGKKDKKAEAEEEKKDAKKKGMSAAMVAAMQEQLKKRKEEEERLERLEEERNRLADEREEARLEAVRLEAEKKEKKKQREADRKARLKAEGKLLTKKQKEDRARAQALLDSLKAQGLEIPDPNDRRAPRPGTRIRPNKKKGPKETAEEEEAKAAAEEAAAAAAAATAAEAPKEEVVKESWDATDSEAEPEPDEESSETTNNGKADEDEDTDEDDSGDDDDSDDSDDESGDETDEKEETLANDPESRRLRAEARIIKRQSDAEKKRTTDELRAGVVCVLGHVDTGKTKILDKLRRTNVQDSEAGGITQQIGATNVPIDAIKEQTKYVKSAAGFEHRLPGLLIIDTPGHESFSNLRNRGSSLCDIAILVVDIMHGLEPQTLESIQLLKKKRCPFIVALNKVDRLYDWQVLARRDVRDVIKEQQSNTQLEFQQRTKDVILQFAEQGLNAALFYENTDPKTYISLVPTSAITGEGMGNLLFMITDYCQNMLTKRLMYSEELQATVLEVKALPGLGTTIDAILINGKLREGQTMVLAGTDGPIVTQIRSLLMPQPMRELRVKNAYVEHKEVKAAQGVKIAAKDLEKAIAGINLLIAHKPDEVDICKEEVARELKSALSHIKLAPAGVYVQASTLGSLEALLEFLRTSKIPYSAIRIGPVVKRDVMKASTMLEHEAQYATILAFDVKIEREAQEMAESLGVKIFQADIIYHLFDKFTAYREELKQKKREEFRSIAVFPCKLRILPQFIFNSRDPIVMGVIVENGIVKVGTPICVPSKEFVDIGIVTSIESNHKNIDSARKGQEICIKIEPIPGESPKMFGRHFEAEDMLVSKISRQSIDACKDYFRDDLIKADWALMVELKKLFEIL
ncbi:eukaryotic translation initiation factor 5B isoform X1 [Drosophila subobscura]|uniref:eukaryotic translation initiation factor 5B isoform X1 n=1 Tax=Drosophila subobscura TaxID=7241 RepID=UPI00155B03F6|nr:eukaryotic translation initiation factor 5B isoform X1 [Drosophila subobscura]XP_034658089.1 eukaryotic translation initiation factor 5B isoform X1 [Drosophila subobscura]